MKHRVPALVLSLIACAGAPAAVLESGADWFAVESSVLVPAEPQTAYLRLTGEISQWWDSTHTWSKDARNLSLEARAGGCFCEQLPAAQGSMAGEGSVQHGRVVFAQPGKLLRLDAALGPFQEMAVKGVLTYRFVAEGNATRVTVNYRVSGAMSMEPAKLAPMADAMLAGQMQRFQAFIESGKTRK